MDFTRSVPVALILAIVIYVVSTRYFTHKEQMARANPSLLASLTARVEAIEAAPNGVGRLTSQRLNAEWFPRACWSGLRPRRARPCR